MKNILIIFVCSLFASCSNENPLTGKNFLLVSPGQEMTSTILLQFSSEYVEVFNIKDMLRSVNSYAKAPYVIERNIFHFHGDSYNMERSKDGFDLYKGHVLKYRLLASKDDLVGRALAESLIKKVK